MMHMSDEIPVPSAENPRVKPAIDQVIKTALAKKKTDRFPSMRDMHRALAQARNDVEDTPAPRCTGPTRCCPRSSSDSDGRLPPPLPPGGRRPADSVSGTMRSRRRGAGASSPSSSPASSSFGVAAGVTLALRRPGATVSRNGSPHPHATPAPAPPAAPAPPRSAPFSAAGAEETPPVDEAPSATGESKSAAQSGQAKAGEVAPAWAAKRNDPVKW